MRTAIQSITAFAALAAAAPPITIPAPAVTEDKNATIFGRGTDAPSGNKKGLVYSNGAATLILARPGSASWAYNWGASALQAAPNFQPIPMYWGPGRMGDVDGVWRMIKDGNSPYVLGYQEPDWPRPTGSEATPQEAYAAWGNDMFRFADAGVKLVCPGITSHNYDNGGPWGGPSGLKWLRKFASIGGNNPDQFRCSAQALHWYGEEGASAARQAGLFITYIQQAHGEVNDIFRRDMPLWITEFAPWPTGDEKLMADFLRIVVPWLDRQDYVHRYAPYWANGMVDLDKNDLNDAGRAFVESRG